MTLVNQLDSGHGYTLRGSRLLEAGYISKEQYSGKLFFHPPGGVVLFWLFFKVFNLLGYPLAQLFSYTLFFWSMMLLGNLTGIFSTKFGPVILACMSAFNPIMSHVITNFWLDGPVLAFSTCAVSVFIWSVARGKLSVAVLAGVIFGYSCLIKQTAFLIVPGLALFTWFLLRPIKPHHFVKFGIGFLATAIMMQLPWEIWQWITVGPPFARHINPFKTLMETNPYIYYVTVVRSSWIYFSLLPRILWTTVPSILLSIILWHDKKIRNLGLSLWVWICVVLSAHIILGFM